MPAPFPSTLVSLLRNALRVVEDSGLLSARSAALQNLRAAVDDVARELEPLAELESPGERLDFKTGADLYH